MNAQTRFVKVVAGIELELFKLPFLYELPAYINGPESLVIHNHIGDKPIHTGYEVDHVNGDEVTISRHSDTIIMRTIYLKEIKPNETNTH